MRLGFVCSSGGAALFSALSIYKACGNSIEPYIVTDRVCGARTQALEYGYDTEFISFINKAQFSTECLNYFRLQEVENVLLFYTRLVASPLIDVINVSNIHPSLLPSYKGIGAVSKARAAGSLFLGASLHDVDAEMDEGLLQCQVLTTNLQGMSLEKANKVSFLQKVWLTLNWFDRQKKGLQQGSELYPQSATVTVATQSLPRDLLCAFEALEQQELGCIGG